MPKFSAIILCSFIVISMIRSSKQAAPDKLQSFLNVLQRLDQAMGTEQSGVYDNLVNRQRRPETEAASFASVGYVYRALEEQLFTANPRRRMEVLEILDDYLKTLRRYYPYNEIIGYESFSDLRDALLQAFYGNAMAILARYNVQGTGTSTASTSSRAGTSTQASSSSNYTPPIALSNTGADSYKLQSLTLPAPKSSKGKSTSNPKQPPLRINPTPAPTPTALRINQTPAPIQAPSDDPRTAAARAMAEEVIRRRNLRNKNKQKLEPPSKKPKK